MRILILFTCLFLAYSCIKPSKYSNEQPIEALNEKIIIANEGGFGKGNADISYINPQNDEINNELFKKANNNGVLGDVFQSISFKNNLAYCVLNNSGAIKILNLDDFKLIGTISGLNQPRYMSFINANTAIVSALSLNTNAVYNPISIINTDLFTKTASIPMQGWTEGTLSFGNNTFICNYYKGMLYKLNNSTLQIMDSVNLSYGCSEAIPYKDGQIVVLCNGDYNNSNSVSKIYMMDTANLNLTKTIVFARSGYSNISYAKAENELLILGENKIKKIETDNNVISDFIVADSASTFYGFGYDEKYKKYYVCDAKDYQQKGQVIIYDKNRTKIKALTAGYIPSKVYFRY
jgi:DNA-binding beta-propeller fold protein YncE